MRRTALMLIVFSACSSTPCSIDAGMSCDGGGTMGTTGALSLSWTLAKNGMVRACSEVPGANAVFVSMSRDGEPTVTETFECSDAVGVMTAFDFGSWNMTARLQTLDGGTVAPPVTRTVSFDATQCTTTIVGSCARNVSIQFDVD